MSRRNAVLCNICFGDSVSGQTHIIIKIELFDAARAVDSQENYCCSMGPHVSQDHPMGKLKNGAGMVGVIL
jgi:hypothetical protein